MATYDVIVGKTLDELVDKVNRLVSKRWNWRPIGGIAVVHRGSEGLSFYQAVTMDQELPTLPPVEEV